MRTVSGSWRCVVKRDWPGGRRSSQGWISASDRLRRGGQPSTTPPIAGPWLSPQVVTRNKCPKLLCDIEHSSAFDGGDVGRVRMFHPDRVIAAIDVMHLSGDAGGQIGQQIKAGSSDFVDRHVAPHRRIKLVPAQDVAKITDSGGRERF